MKRDLKCKVCGYGWTPRKAKGGMPLRCPNPFCQSIFWNGKPIEKGYPKRKRA